MSGLPQTHPLALFTLIPRNHEATAALEDVQNRHLVSQVVVKGEIVRGLDVGPNISSRSRDCLATLGRSNCDIVIPNGYISKLQCDFQILPNGVVMLRDLSTFHTTQVMGYDKPCIQFEQGGPRQIILSPEVNLVIGMAGQSSEMVLFELLWHDKIEEKLRRVFGNNVGKEDRNAFARTRQWVPLTVGSVGPLTRIHAAPSTTPSPRYIEIATIGKGNFGVVSKACNADTGALIAVKTVQMNRGSPSQVSGTISHQNENGWIGWDQIYRLIKREVETLSRIDHPHIVKFIGHETHMDEAKVVILTELMEGSLEAFVRAPFRDPNKGVCCQMLRALTYLEGGGLVHRDLKPANILYRRLAPDIYLYKLADFGLCAVAKGAGVQQGTPIFAAPEISSQANQQKVDVWSLFATMIYMFNVNNFQNTPWGTEGYEDVHSALMAASNHRTMRHLKPMADKNPDTRPSAAYMLQKVFNEGAQVSRFVFPASMSTVGPAIGASGLGTESTGS